MHGHSAVVLLQYVLPPAVLNSSQGCPVVSTCTPQSALPAASATWLRRGAQLVTPEAGEQLEADRMQTFALRVPGAHEVALVPRTLAWLQQSRAQGGASVGRPRMSTQDAVEVPNGAGLVAVPWDAEEEAFRMQLVVPRADMLDVVARMDADAPWQQLLRLQLLPESQHLRERPDLVFEPPVPDKRDPTFSLVWFRKSFAADAVVLQRRQRDSRC